jgi:RND family efflux transporter MFP subunit
MQTEETLNRAVYGMNPGKRNGDLKKRITGRALILFVVLLVLLTFFSNTINNFTLPRVTVEYPQPGDIVKEIGGDGTVEARESWEKYAASGAMVDEVLVKPGDRVKKGQRVMALDTEELEGNLKDETARYEQKKLQLEKLQESSAEGEPNSYERNVRAAGKKLEQKQKAFDDIKALYELGAESRQSMENAESELQDAKEEAENAEYSLKQAYNTNLKDMENLRYDMEIQQRNIEELRKEIRESASVAAPCDGIITEIGFDRGMMANTTRPLFKVIDTAKGFELKATLDADLAKYLAVGEKADVSVEAISDRKVEGRIAEISDNEGQKGTKMDVYITVDMEGLTGGEAGQVSIKKRMKSNGILVSNDAIRTDSDGEYVLVVKEREGALGKENYVEKIRITTGESDRTKTAVTEGTMRMDRIVVKSSKSIEEGDRVIVEK